MPDMYVRTYINDWWKNIILYNNYYSGARTPKNDKNLLATWIRPLYTVYSGELNVGGTNKEHLAP